MIIQPPHPLQPVLQAMRVPFQPEPLPKLSITPGKLESHDIDPWSIYDSPTDTLVAELNRRLFAEDARLRRLLPPAPEGTRWVGEVGETSAFGGTGFSAVTTFRIRYRLASITPRPPDG